MDDDAGTLVVRIHPPGGAVVERRLAVDRPPDLDAVDRLARIVLVAARAGAWVELVDPAPALVELLELAGLAAGSGDGAGPCGGVPALGPPGT